jgi:hypothetical protein
MKFIRIVSATYPPISIDLPYTTLAFQLASSITEHYFDFEIDDSSRSFILKGGILVTNKSKPSVEISMIDFSID